jgi:hypothetical protein
MLGLSPRGSYFGKFEQNPLYGDLDWVKATGISGLLEKHVCNFGLVWNWLMESYWCILFLNPIRGGATGLNTKGAL